jgi:hypothetical protein
MCDKGFIYSFWDENNNLLYIGKTEGALLDRLRAHTHCEKKLYEETTIIKFFNCTNPLILDMVEKILIGQLLPPYNIRDVYDANVIADFIDATKFSFQYEWIELPQEVFHFQKNKLTKEDIKQRQADGIKRAKAEGKYKGRKSKEYDTVLFEQMLKEWRAGERTAVSIQRHFGITAQTFYRWEKKYPSTYVELVNID